MIVDFVEGCLLSLWKASSKSEKKKLRNPSAILRLRRAPAGCRRSGRGVVFTAPYRGGARAWGRDEARPGRDFLSLGPRASAWGRACREEVEGREVWLDCLRGDASPLASATSVEAF